MGLRPTNSNEHHGGAPSLILKDFARDVRRSVARNLVLSSSVKSRFLVALLLGMTESVRGAPDLVYTRNLPEEQRWMIRRSHNWPARSSALIAVVAMLLFRPLTGYAQTLTTGAIAG